MTLNTYISNILPAGIVSSGHIEVMIPGKPGFGHNLGHISIEAP